MTQSKNSNKFQSKKINCRNNIHEKVIKNKIIDTIKIFDKFNKIFSRLYIIKYS